ncbi:hypothetical protein ACFVUF_04995, partial [Lysinibacillus sp. NPDC058154]|uniref:hypothetical protein n=1 Tax=Lysinibacillus sp. NPDC058154 TaxID=3346358 RepID=UPI0036DCCB44
LGSWLLALGSWLLALGSWLLALGSWLLALGSWLFYEARTLIISRRSEKSEIASSISLFLKDVNISKNLFK